MSKPTILTGLRANEDLHIGNYFGALMPMVDLAREKAENYKINLFVPDLHSFTTPIDHSKLQAQINHNLKLFVAAGLPLDNPDVHIYRQSRVPAHSELTVILGGFTGVGEMNRMTQFKDKSANQGEDRVSVGLFNYPVLMAADILLYDAEYVPVGDDQAQHLEFTRDIAERMNNRFGNLFTLPASVQKQHEFFGNDQGLRIMDLADPTKKMSKSDESGKGVIFLSDTPEEAKKKIMSATTDNLAEIAYRPASKPGISNLLQILALLSGSEVHVVASQHSNTTSYGAFKEEVADKLADFLAEFHKRFSLINDEEIKLKLEKSEAEMNEIANAKLAQVQKAVGLR